MKPERWRIIRRMFEEALDQPTAERQVWLDRVCGEDAQLRAEIEVLLQADRVNDDFLDQPPVVNSPSLAARIEQEWNARSAPESRTASGSARRGPTARFPPGALLADRYRIVTLLGSGGMGDVYRAEDLRLDSTVALKFLPPAEQDDERLQGFLDELKLARRVTHPNVCRLYDLVESEAGLFLSMEWVDGDDLASLLRRVGRLPQEKALDAARQLASGLAAIHERGILHRDLKPANVMLDREGQLRIMDFGIAGLARSWAVSRRGTPAYMAPELLAGQAATERSDLFALGRLLQEMFHGLEADGTPHADSETSAVAVEIDPEIEQIILRCQAPDLASRPVSAMEVEKALASRAFGDAADGSASWRPRIGEPLPRRPHWRLARRLSQGGFGDVWLAEHGKTGEARVFKFCYDIKRLRALKREVTIYRLLKESLGDRDDISRILDWNFDHLPYFIEAEYTQGGALDLWAIDQGGLSTVPLPVRLEIIVQIATALAAAHSVGVLHQDVKPGNILVARDARGELQVRLSDFGIGEVLAQDQLLHAGITALGFTTATETLQHADSRQGTRIYMAPEILEGQAATVQADLYALGVLLYQMVVGDFTRVVGQGWERDIEDDILRQDIAQLVDRAPERRPGDALRIANRLRRLEERRQERWQVEQQTADAAKAKADLVIARRRRRIGLLAMLILLIGALLMAIQAHRIRQEVEAVRQVSNFLKDLFTVSDPDAEWTGELKARQILDWGAKRIDQELETQPRIRAQLMLTMGEVFNKLGLYDDAEGLVEQSLDLRRALYSRKDNHPEVAESLDVLARTLTEQGDLGRAEQASTDSLRMRRALFGTHHVDIAESLETLAHLRSVEGRAEAVGLYEEALAIRRQVQGERALDVARSAVAFGRYLVVRGEHDEAIEVLNEALQIQRERLGSEHPSLAVPLTQLGFVDQVRGEFDAARQRMDEALRLRREALGDTHPDVALSLGSLAFLHEARGDFAAAIETYDKEYRLYQLLFGDHARTALVLDRMARVHQSVDRYEDAERLLHQSLEMRTRMHGGEHQLIVESLNRLGFFLLAKGDTEDGVEMLQRSFEIYQSLDDQEGHRSGTSLLYHGIALEARGETASAEASYRAALDRYSGALGDNHPSIALVKYYLGNLLLAQENVDGAERMIREGLDAAIAVLDRQHWRVAILESTLGSCLAKRGRFDEAETFLLPAYRLIREKKGRRALYAVRALRRIVTLYEWSENKESAEIYRQQWLEIRAMRGEANR